MKLGALANQHGIPLVIDNAYGVPFPGIIFSEAHPLWNPNIVLCMSLSKLGLPGSRCGIIIANEKIISAVSNIFVPAVWATDASVRFGNNKAVHLSLHATLKKSDCQKRRTMLFDPGG